MQANLTVCPTKSGKRAEFTRVEMCSEDMDERDVEVKGAPDASNQARCKWTEFQNHLSVTTTGLDIQHPLCTFTTKYLDGRSSSTW